jgi:tetratricopeptide (TPR) repeat protein
VVTTTVLVPTLVLCGAAFLLAEDALAGQTGQMLPGAAGPRAPVLAAPAPAPAALTPLDKAQSLYYNGRYEPSAAQAAAVRDADPSNLAAYEIRTAALLFQVKRLIGEPKDKDKAVKACEPCADLIAAFTEDIATGRALAHARLTADPADLEAQFFLGKLDLNYIWLHLGPLGRRTGWTEYREARRTLDGLLQTHPDHLRARVARAWIDYIVDTRVSFMFRWVLGGGDKGKALRVVREAAAADADFFTAAEAKFALWEMLAREKQFAEAADVARGLLRDFPENRELVRFVGEHGTTDSTP